MLTQKGMEVLSQLYGIHREWYIANHDGHSENDCERDFLHKVLNKTETYPDQYNRLSDQIETIR